MEAGDDMLEIHRRTDTGKTRIATGRDLVRGNGLAANNAVFLQGATRKMSRPASHYVALKSAETAADGRLFDERQRKVPSAENWRGDQCPAALFVWDFLGHFLPVGHGRRRKIIKRDAGQVLQQGYVARKRFKMFHQCPNGHLQKLNAARDLGGLKPALLVAPWR